MRTRIVVVAVVAFGLFLANEFTRTISVYVAAALWGTTIGLLVGCWKLAKVVRPADAPPPLTGPPLAKAGWLTGTIGTTRGVSPLWVTLYADRLVVGMPMVARRTVMADQLGLTTTDGREIWIEHSAPGLLSPVRLRLRRNHPLRQALDPLARSR